MQQDWAAEQSSMVDTTVTPAPFEAASTDDWSAAPDPNAAATGDWGAPTVPSGTTQEWGAGAGTGTATDTKW